MNKPPAFCTTAVLVLLVIGLFNLGWGSAWAGSVTYEVSVNTSTLSGQGGNLDFQFNPGGSSALAATATITTFQTVGGILSQPAILTGDATGSLPGTLTLINDTPYNDAFQGFTYGSSFSFGLTLSGLALNSPGGMFGSSFAVSLYDAAGVTPLLTTDPNGSVLTVNLDVSGTTSAVTFTQSPTNSTPVAIAIPAGAVPEPRSFVLLSLGVLGLLAFGLGRQRAVSRAAACRRCL